MNHSDALDAWVDARIQLALKDLELPTNPTEPVHVVDASICVPHFNSLANLESGKLNDNTYIDWELALRRGSIHMLVDRENYGYRLYVTMPKTADEDISINDTISLVELDRLWLED